MFWKHFHFLYDKVGLLGGQHSYKIFWWMYEPVVWLIFHCEMYGLFMGAYGFNILNSMIGACLKQVDRNLGSLGPTNLSFNPNHVGKVQYSTSKTALTVQAGYRSQLSLLCDVFFFLYSLWLITLIYLEFYFCLPLPSLIIKQALFAFVKMLVSFSISHTSFE